MDALREALLARREALQADLNALAGAMSQLDWTLKEMERVEAGDGDMEVEVVEP